MTLHELVDDLTEYLDLTDEEQFRVTAKIKRLIHNEKASVYHRYHLYSLGRGIYEGEGEDRKKVGQEPPEDPWLSQILYESYEQHSYLSTLPDESLVTWNVGTHIFEQEE